MQTNEFTKEIAEIRRSLQSLEAIGDILVEDVSPNWLPTVFLTKVCSAQRFNEWGRGITMQIAVLGGLMERIERLSAYLAPNYIKQLNTSPKTSSLPIISLSQLGLCNFQRFLNLEITEEDCTNKFVEVERLGDSAKFLAPASRVFMGYNRGLRDYSCSTGLAAHFEEEEAIKRAILEVLERHFHHIVTFSSAFAVEEIIIDSPGSLLMKDFLVNLRDYGFNYRVFRADFYEGLYSLIVTLEHERDHTMLNKHCRFHCAVHGDLLHGVERALTEMILARIYCGWFPNVDSVSSYAFSPYFPQLSSKKIIYNSALPEFDSYNSIREFVSLADKLETQIFICKLTNPKMNIPVVRALIPGLQPNFDLMGKSPTDFQSRITPHLEGYSQWIDLIHHGQFHQQGVTEQVSTLKGSEKGFQLSIAEELSNPEKRLPPCILEFEGFKVPLTQQSLAIGDTITKRRTRRCLGKVLRLEQLSTLLDIGIGFKEIDFDQTFGFYTRRNYPSPGSRHSLETFIEVRNIEGLQDGLYHYRSNSSVLTYLSSIVDLPELHNETLEDSPACILYFFSDYKRLSIKYPNSVERFAHLEAGHLGQNILLICEEIELNATPLGSLIGNRVTKYVKRCRDMLYVYAIAIGGR